MRYSPLPSSFYQSNRNRLFRLLKRNSVAVFLSNDVIPVNADASYPFRQNSDIFYFTGIEQEETYLILRKGEDGTEETNLFITPSDRITTIWTGKKLSKKQAREISGVEVIEYNSKYEKVLRKVLNSTKTLFLSGNPDSPNKKIPSASDRLMQWCNIEFPSVKVVSDPFHQLRLVKSPLEIERIQQACKITEIGFIRSLEYMRPGIKEYEMEAELNHEFLKHGSNGFAYEPIVASGANACILHYTQNDQVCRKGEMVLLDIGAEYGRYASDLTRTIPVSGRFTSRQKSVYIAVLKVQQFAMDLLKAGLPFSDYNSAIGSCMENELLKLKLISKTDIRKQDPKNKAYRTFFMHGTSHQLGLDVHDVGGKIYDKFKVNMVITVEPGIYIQKEKLGIRIENNVVIKKNGIIDLMKSTPKEVDEIEELMNRAK